MRGLTWRKDLLVFAAVGGLLCLISAYNFLLFHGLIELFSVCVAWSIFFLAWNARQHFDNGFFLFVGTAYLLVGGVDMLHTLAYKGMGVFPGFGANLPTQLWILARFVEALSLLAGLYFLKRSLQPHKVLTFYLALGAVGIGAIFAGWFPDCYLPETGLTGFKVGSEYVIIGLLGAYMYGLYRVRGLLKAQIVTWLMWSAVLTIGAELAFTFYVGVYDLSNLIGHVFKLASFFLIYKAMVQTGVAEPYALISARLQEANRQLRTIYERAPIGIFSVSPSEPYGFVNPEFQRILGLDPMQARWDENPQVHEYPGKFFQVLEEIRQELLEKGEVRDREIQIRQQDNALVWASFFARLGPGYNGQRHMEGFVIDISERKKAELLRINVDRIMRHDLKTPLNGIVGMAQLLNEEELDSEQQEYVQYILEAGYKMQKQIQWSLILMKIEQGVYELTPKSFDLGDLLRRLHKEMAHLRQNKQVRTTYVVQGQSLDVSDVSYVIQAEETPVEFMLGNLLNNAYEASPPDSQITVSLTAHQTGHEVALHNWGTIPVEIRNRLFDPYVTSGKKYGTGLGTYSADLIAKAHQGTISFRTSDDEGTEFVVWIPGQVQSG